MAIDKERLKQWIEDKKYVYGSPDSDDTDEKKAIWSGCMRILNGLSGFIDTRYFDGEETKTPDESSEVQN